MAGGRADGRRALPRVGFSSCGHLGPHHGVCPLTDAIDLQLTRHPGDSNVPSRSSGQLLLSVAVSSHIDSTVQAS